MILDASVCVRAFWWKSETRRGNFIMSSEPLAWKSIIFFSISARKSEMICIDVFKSPATPARLTLSDVDDDGAAAAVLPLPPLPIAVETTLFVRCIPLSKFPVNPKPFRLLWYAGLVDFGAGTGGGFISFDACDGFFAASTAGVVAAGGGGNGFSGQFEIDDKGATLHASFVLLGCLSGMTHT